MENPLMAELISLARNAHGFEKEAIQAEQDLALAKTRLVALRGELESLIARLTLQAQAEGKLDGRNAETRAAQLAAYLDERILVREAKDEIAAQERTIADLEARAATARASARLCARMFEAQLAALRTEEPGRSVVILATSEPETKPKEPDNPLWEDYKAFKAEGQALMHVIAGRGGNQQNG